MTKKIIGKSIGHFDDVVTARADNNLLVFLETERMRAEEKERIQEEKERIRQQECADDWRREDQRFMMMMMLKPQHPVAPIIPPPIQDSLSSSQVMDYEFDGQDTIEQELIRRTTGV